MVMRSGLYVIGSLLSTINPLSPQPLTPKQELGFLNMEHWREIYSFPEYSVSSFGRVRNNHNGHLMTLLRNQQGVVHVGLTKNRIQHRRSVTLLVATAFLPSPPNESFDTPIHLDGDRSNNYAINLMWRPRWFAIKYFRQFQETWLRGGKYETPIEEVDSKEYFKSSWEAAIMYGLLVYDVYISTIHHTYVWPTNQRFRTSAQILSADITSR